MHFSIVDTHIYGIYKIVPHEHIEEGDINLKKRIIFFDNVLLLQLYSKDGVLFFKSYTCTV